MGKSLVVSKSNKLARTGNNLTLVEARVVEYCLSTIYKEDKITEDTVFEVDVAAMGEYFGITRSNAYRELKDVFLNILSKRLSYPLGTEGWQKVTHWIASVDYNDGIFGLRIRFTKEVIKHISGSLIKANFTCYPLTDMVKFKSNYTVIIYSFCKSYAHNKARYRVEVSLQDFRTLLYLQETEYLLWGSLNRVVQRAIAEIQEHTNLLIELIPKKTGKQVTHLLFIMKYKQSKGTT